MNDFTLKELKCIFSWAETCDIFGCSVSYNVDEPLIDKIQSMIDKYESCDHSWVFDSERMPIGKICIKCGSIK